MGKMLEEFVKQGRKLFSSKENGAKLVRNQVDQLHHWKLVLLASSIVILIGYSQFRVHFSCKGDENIDTKMLTPFCWINGTTTVVTSTKSSIDLNKQTSNFKRKFNQSKSTNIKSTGGIHQPHVGASFPLKEDKHEILNHNYMRSIWSMLILMSGFSFFAKRFWATILERDFLIALLDLPGHNESPIAGQIKATKPYDSLMNAYRSQCSTDIRQLCRNKSNRDTIKQTVFSPKIEDQKLSSVLKLDDQNLSNAVISMIGESNVYSHSLDSYIDNLLYFLLAPKAIMYQNSSSSLKFKVLMAHLVSLFFSLMQFILPWLIIGDRYKLYGWKYLKLWIAYTLKQILEPDSSINSMDYDLSAEIWPTLTQCRYLQFGLKGMESHTYNCIVPINEICAKLFAAIWWLVAISIILETYHLIILSICSLNYDLIRLTFGLRFWPRARKEAEFIVNFRYRHSKLLERLSRNQDMDRSSESLTECESINEKLSVRDHKRIESENDRSKVNRNSFVCSIWRTISPITRSDNLRTRRNDEGLKEVREDSDIYFVLYLIYMRLGCSRRQIEYVIRCSTKVLEPHLCFMGQLAANRDPIQTEDLARHWENLGNQEISDV